MVKLDSIKQIKQTFVEKDVNELLDEGFEILKIFSSKISNQNFEETKPVYILGRAKKKRFK